MKEIRLANKIVKTLVKDRMQYPGRLVLDTFSMIARCGVLLILYWYVFKLNNGLINSTAYIIVAWSMFFYFVFSIMRLREISRAIMQDVQTGNVEVLFCKPISYLKYKMWWQIGSGLYSFLFVAFLGTIIMALIIGFPSTMAIGIFLPTLFLSILKLFHLFVL